MGCVNEIHYINIPPLNRLVLVRENRVFRTSVDQFSLDRVFFFLAL